MPASEASLRITDTYRAQLLALRARAAQLVRFHWGVLDPARLDDTFPAWLAAATATLTQAQRIAAATSSAYLAAFAASEGAARRSSPPPVTEPGVAADGRPVRDALAPALITVKVRIKQGASVQDALASGEFRGVRLVASEVMQTARMSLDASLSARADVVGYRRVTSGNPCGACMAAATGAIQHEAVLLRVHDHCRCTKEPVFHGSRDGVQRPTGRELFDSLSPAHQAALFAGRGGEEKASLVRSGAVPFEALIAPISLASVPDGITEATLESLQAAQ